MASMDIETNNGGATGGSCGEHCFRNRKPYSICGGICLLVFVIIMAISWDTVAPTEFALLRNGVTGVVDMNTVYTSGRYFVGPSQRFIHFPAQLVTLSFGNKTNDEQPLIRARTGADVSEETSSGGQPVELSLSFQYRLVRDAVPNLYQAYGTRWETFYMRFAQQAITNVAQGFTPRAFWTQREAVESVLLNVVNASVYDQGFATIEELQLRSVGFQSIYEQTITNIQLQEQLRVTKSYQLDVTRVEKMVDLLQSEADATVLEINAEAARERAVIEGEANAAALQREQSARATMYARLREHLGWSAESFLQYMKMKALNMQSSQGNVVVGVNGVGSVAGS